jgi:hypothetical protein
VEASTAVGEAPAQTAPEASTKGDEKSQPEKDGTALTYYHVFEKQGAAWHSVSEDLAARSSKQAISLYLAGKDHMEDAKEKTFVAVPVRSWQPVTVKKEVQTTLKFT